MLENEQTFRIDRMVAELLSPEHASVLVIETKPELPIPPTVIPGEETPKTQAPEPPSLMSRQERDEYLKTVDPYPFFDQEDHQRGDPPGHVLYQRGKVTESGPTTR